MAKAQESTSIELPEEDVTRESTMSETNTPVVKNGTEAQEALGKEPRQKRQRRRKEELKNTWKGISPESPVVRLLPEEKQLIKRLEAYILLKTGETFSDHQLIMDAIREYSKKYYPDF